MTRLRGAAPCAVLWLALMPTTYDFDFQRYIARRKGLREAQVREGAAYAFPGDSKLLRTLNRLRPVELALEEAARLFRDTARAELLGTAVRATPERYAKVHDAAARCAKALHLPTPPVFITPLPVAQTGLVGAVTLGTTDEASVVLPAVLAESLSAEELTDLLGRECGRIQNGHVPFMTALFYLKHTKSGLTRWAVRPATATLAAWARRAQITADRAGLCCTRSLETSLVAQRRSTSSEGGAAVVDPLAFLDLPRRERALTRFAASQYFRRLLNQEGGEPASECDAAVNQILGDDDAPAPGGGAK